jgi:nitrogen fixation/metabolism regulation signal transduction histidine kinase
MAQIHPAAPHNLPGFLPGPDGSDGLLVVTAVIVVAIVLVLGSLFFRLHSLPERMAHKGHKLQFELVAVLCLLSLFTHIHMFWVAGLLLALIRIPDFGGMFDRVARALEKGADAAAARAPEAPPAPPEAPRAGEKG